MLLTRQQLAKKNKTRFQTVDLPDGDSIVIRSMSEKERGLFDTSLITKDGGKDLNNHKVARQRLILWIACNEDHSPMFPPRGTSRLGLPVWPAEDWDLVDGLDSLVSAAIWEAGLKHCGIIEADINELVKNSNDPPAGDSP